MPAEMEITIINVLDCMPEPVPNSSRPRFRYESRIELLQGEQCADAKSIKGLMMPAAPQGSRLFSRPTASTQKKAAEEISQLINERFGEEE